jgi:beta-glucosidase
MEKHLDSSIPAAERADALLSKMSVEEKIGQLCKLDGFRSYERHGDSLEINKAFKDKFAEVQIGTMYGLLRADWWTGRNWDSGLEPRLMAEGVDMFQRYVVENTRLHIPLMIAEEAPHGLMALGCTVFPTGLGLGATWNPELVEKAAAVIGSEGSAAGIHTVYGPILDIPRDPRWSRTEEDFSEDPVLTSSLGVAYVVGLQGGSFPKRGGLFSTLKHIAAHGDPEGGHNSAPNHLGPIEFRNVQFRPFEACVKAGARSAMCAYNTIDGIPCAANRKMLTGILREELGFDGFVVADRGAIPLLKHHRFAADEAEASAKALKAGLDTDEGFIDFHSKGLREALRRGLIELDDIDRAVRRVLLLKFRLGLFEDPYFKSGKAVELIGAKTSRELALEVARQSLTLISNKEEALPLKDARRIAVIGPNADTPMNQLGDYSAPQRREDVITVLDGMKEQGARRGIAIRYAKGCKVRSLRRDMMDDAMEAAKESDAVILVLGGSSSPDGDSGFLENGASRIKEVKEDSEFDKESGEGYDRAKLRLAGLQLELLRELKTLGKRIVTVLIMGRPLIIDEVAELSDATLLAWYPGMQGGRAIAEAIFGDVNPGGRLPISFPKDEAQLPVYYYSNQPRTDYIDMTGKPSFQFGFGLSYTKFEYSNLKLDAEAIAPDGSITASVDLRNAGLRDGDEVTQLYLTAHSSSVARPYRELKAFRRVTLKAGVSETVSFKLSSQELGVYGEDLKWRVEPGRFTVAVGGSLDNLLEVEFKVS